MAILCCMMILSSCSKKSSVISHEDMAHIYMEMLMRDQWISSNYSQRSKADTTFVYGSILEDYGYTRDDYIESVGFYVDHPEILTAILERTVKLLEGRQLVVENLIEERDNYLRDSTARALKKAHLDSVLNSLPDPDWTYSDSLYAYKAPKYKFSMPYSEAYKERRTVELDSLHQDSLRVARRTDDRMKLETLRKKHVLVDSLLMREKDDSLVVPVLERERHRLDSLIPIMERLTDTTKKEKICLSKELLQNIYIPFPDKE